MKPLKTPRLHETDFARIAPLASADAKRAALMRLKGGFSPFSYNPTRKHLSAILNAKPILLMDEPDVTWEAVKSAVEKSAASHPKGIAPNLEVSQMLFDLVRAGEMRAIEHGLGSFQAGPGQKLQYWSDAYIVRGEDLIIPGFDFRRQNGLGALALKFAFSVSHAHVRESSSDFSDALLGVFQFQQLPNQQRTARLIQHAESSHLFTYEEIIQMSNETTAIWREINEERADEAKRSGTEDLPLFKDVG